MEHELVVVGMLEMSCHDTRCIVIRLGGSVH